MMTKDEIIKTFGVNTICIKNKRTGEEVFLEDGQQTIFVLDGQNLKQYTGVGLIRNALNQYVEMNFKEGYSIDI